MLAGRQGSDASDIRRLFDEIVHEPVTGFIVYPRWCNDMEAVVLATYGTDFRYRPKYNLIEFRSRTDGKLSMAAERSLATTLCTQSSPEALLAALVDHALPHVQAGNYSRYWTADGRQNGPLQADDLQFVAKALAHRAA